MVTKEELGERIKKVMKERDVTQKMLADKIGITQSKISNYVNGKNFPPVDVLASIAEELHISLDCLVYGIPESKDEPSEQTYEFNTCGDVARMLFALSDKTAIRIIKRKEDCTEFDTSTGYPEKTKRTVYLIRFGGFYTLRDDSVALNKFFGEWMEMESTIDEIRSRVEKASGTLKVDTSADTSIKNSIKLLFDSWKEERIRDLAPIGLQKYDYIERMLEDGELPF